MAKSLDTHVPMPPRAFPSLTQGHTPHVAEARPKEPTPVRDDFTPQNDAAARASERGFEPEAGKVVLKMPVEAPLTRVSSISPMPADLVIANLEKSSIDVTELRKHLDALAKPQNEGYAQVQEKAAAFSEAYERGEFRALSTDQARVYTPHLQEVPEPDVPALLRAGQQYARAIGREALSILLKKNPHANVVLLFGPAGAGKSRLLRRDDELKNLAPNLHSKLAQRGCIVYETQTFRDTDLIKELHPACTRDNPKRDIAVVLVIAKSDIAAQRQVRRFLETTERQNLHMIPEYVLGGYEQARNSASIMRHLCGTLSPQPSSFTVETSQSHPREVTPGDLPAIGDDLSIAIEAAKNMLQEVVAPDAQQHYPAWHARATFLTEAIRAFEIKRSRAK